MSPGWRIFVAYVALIWTAFFVFLTVIAVKS